MGLLDNDPEGESGAQAKAHKAVDAVLERFPHAETPYSVHERGLMVADEAFERALAIIAAGAASCGNQE